jgi:hypothetical protein
LPHPTTGDLRTGSPAAKAKAANKEAAQEAAEHAAKNMIYRLAYAQAASEAAMRVKNITKAASEKTNVDNFKGTSKNKTLSKADLAAIQSQKIHDSVAKEVQANREQRATLVPDQTRRKLDKVKKKQEIPGTSKFRA